MQGRTSAGVTRGRAPLRHAAADGHYVALHEYSAPVMQWGVGENQWNGGEWTLGDEATAPGADCRIHLLENEALYGRLGVYTGPDGQPFPDGLARAVFHCQAALTLPVLLNWRPDVVHCHDAEAALTAF